MVKRGGGVVQLSTKVVMLDQNDENLASIILKRNSMLVIELGIHVCDSMGANLVNTVCERIAPTIDEISGGRSALKILSNLCVYRKAISKFEIPVKKMGYKGHPGQLVAKRILEAYLFAKADLFRAVTHNKGVMNGIDAVALATGQDWRAIESAAHSAAVHFNKNGGYSPITKYGLDLSKKGELLFKGEIEIPISVGTRGGVIHTNPLYSQNLNMLNNPNSRELAEIMVSVGLAQNFAALKALAIEGIQKGHMKLHARNLAISAGVPIRLIDKCIEFMKARDSISVETAREFLISSQKSEKL